jgi:site-specific DNA recombinase
MKPETIRCAIYTRKSSEEGLEQSFNSLQAQREACLAYVHSQKHEGWIAAVEHYDDGGFSGGTMERPALERLLADIRAGKIATVVVYKVDRLTRSLADFAKIIEVFDSHQVSFVSVTQQFNTTTSMGRLTLNVLLSFAQFERELTGERIRDKVAASKKKGMWMGGMVPLGYDCVGRRLVVNKSEAETVKVIFQQYVRLSSVMKLRDYLEQKRIRSKIRTSSDRGTYGGGVISRGALYQLLSNRIFLGQIVHCGQSYPGQHDPIITEELWTKVATQLEANNQAHRTSKPCPVSSVLTGLLRDTNGVRFTPTQSLKKGRRYRYYTSQTVIQKRGEEPEVARYPAPELEAVVAAQIRRLLESINQYLTGNEATPEVELAAKRAKAVAGEWSQLSISKQQEFIRTIVKAVTVGHEHLWIEVDKTRLTNTLLGRSPDTKVHPKERSAPIKLTVDFRPIRRGAELQIYTPEGHLRSDKPAPSLLKAIARAYKWREQLISGEVKDVKQIARETGFKGRYIRQILQCAALSPEVVNMILSGRQAPSVTARVLQRHLPRDWRRQKELLSQPA